MKRSNIVAFSIFLFVILSIIVKYLVIKFDINKYELFWKENQKYLENLKEKCFFVEKAYFYNLKDKKYLLIKLPSKYIANINENLEFLGEGIYLLKVVNKVYLDNKELFSTDFIITNSKICVE